MTLEHKIKSKKIEFAVGLIVVMFIVLYCYPRIVDFMDKQDNARVAIDCKATVDVILAKAQEEKKPNLKEIADFVEGELNLSKSKCPLCIQLEFDPKTNTIIVTGYDKTVDVVSRTVVNPPTFVRYER